MRRNFTRSPTSTRGLSDDANVIITEHLRKQMLAKGIAAAQVISALRNPYKVTSVSRYPGQLRYCGGGVAVIVCTETIKGTVTTVLITVYLDGVVTDLRPDQAGDRAAQNSRRLTNR